MTEDEVRSLVTLAGFTVLRVWRLPNGYLGVQEPLTEEQITKDKPGVRGYTTVADDETEGVVRAWMADYRWRYVSPAWLVKTQVGLLQIGWRKRVISISWEETALHAIVTKDDVTKDDQQVHAWSIEKALEYLRALAQAVDKPRTIMGD